jgi:hypothetical protein
MIASRIAAGLFAVLVTASLASLPSLSRGFKGIVWNVYYVFVVEPAPQDD